MRDVQRHVDGCVECAAELERLARLDALTTKLPVATAPARESSLADRLRALVCFEMPQNIVLATRSTAPATASTAFEGAMQEYRERRYGAALDALARARDDGDRTSGLNFYLGACLLDARRTAAAVDAFEQAARERPRLAEYRWYLAQALLLDGRAPDALRELEKASSREGPYRDDARELRERLSALIEGRR